MKTFCLPDGRTLAFRQWGSGPTVVLLHGWGMSSAVFEEVAALLCGQHRLIAPDLRGHGFSDPGSGYALDDFASDLRAWLHSITEPFDLIGWSFGGQVALRLQQLESRRVKRLGLISSTARFVADSGWPHGLPQGQVLAMLRQLKRHYHKAMGEFFDLQFAGEKIAPERYRDIVDFAVRQGRLPQLEAAVETLQTLRRGNLCDQLSGIDCPVIVMHGDQDRICPIGAGRFLARQIPRARMTQFDGLGHAPFLSAPSRVVDAWRAFSQ